jgi:hypothetical protein
MLCAACALHAAPHQEAEPRCIVPVLQGPEEPGTFPGLYSFSLLEQGFDGTGGVLITSQFYSHTAVLRIDTSSGAVTVLTPVGRAAAPGSWTLHSVCSGLAVATLSSPNQPPRLMLAALPAAASGGSAAAAEPLDWVPVKALDADLSGLPRAAAALAGLRCEVLDVVPTVGDTQLPMQAVVQVRRISCGCTHTRTHTHTHGARLVCER